MKKRNLILVESPNKIKTISELLKGDPDNSYIVMASVGHISYIKDSGIFNMGIDVENNFKANYQISPDKKKTVDELKEQVKIADKIYIASDPDREGEFIAWSLKKFLKIPEDKYERITFHEITKKAILNAIANPRKIDEDLVDASDARRKLDKIVGYRLSSNTRTNIGAKSVGRCQSPTLKLLVNREEEINNFKSEEFFSLFLDFKKDKDLFKARYCDKAGETLVIKSLTDCENIINKCENKDNKIYDIEKKEILEYPQAPFTTATYQQEVFKRLGFDLETAMNYAQKLFEGINVGGKHIALTTYLRTDDPNIAPEFLPILENYVKDNYGNKYYSPVKKYKTGENSQEGHECFRVIDLEMTPARLSKYIQDDTLIKIYTLIYNRTLAAAMKPASYSTTKYIIKNDSGEYFKMNSKELLFEGYRIVYGKYVDEDKEEIIKESFVRDEIINKENSQYSYQKEYTKPPKRYTEASLQKELDKRGIGRPSTWTNIIKTVKSKDRNYCEVIKKELVPTELGFKLISYLEDNFKDIVDLNYTAEMEKDLDLIAKGKLNELDFLKTFYDRLDESIKKSVDIKETCPHCGSPLVLRKGPYGAFLGCSNYPKCKYIKKLK